jgi:hypothetical protein
VLILGCALVILKWQICELPNEKEAVYGALDKWTAWETEFPLIAVAKALNILRNRGQWVRVIQVRLPLFYRTCLYFKAEHIHDLRISGEYLPANYAQFIF